jgi:hypothetical protein
MLHAVLIRSMKVCSCPRESGRYSGSARPEAAARRSALAVRLAQSMAATHAAAGPFVMQGWVQHGKR